MSVLRLVYLSIILIKVQYIKQRLMKKVLFFLLTSLLASTAVLRAETLTVNDGSATNNCVPIDVYNCDADFQHSQFIIPATNLGIMNGKIITEMDFYLRVAETKSSTNNWEVRLMEVGTVNFPDGWIDADAAQIVYSGKFPWETTTPALVFDDGYEYNGGHLLIDFRYSGKGVYGDYRYFYGVNSGYSIQDRGSSWGNLYARSQGFLPKITFTYEAASSCAKTASVSVTEITGESATISWSPVDGAESYDLTIGSTIYSNLTSCSKQITGLNPVTEYTVSVVTNCGAGETSGAKSTSFTTACGTISSFPWTETFNSLSSGIPSCWDNSEGTTSDAEYKWNSYTTGQSGKCVRFNSYNNSKYNTNFLTTPTIQLDSKSYKLSFYYKNPKGGDCELYINSTNVATYGQVSSWTLKEYDLSSYAGQSIVIKWKGISNWGSGDAYIYLDEVKIEVDNSCKVPTTLSIPNAGITSNSAQISWTNGGSETAWKIQYKESGAAEFTEVSANSNPFTLTGLNASTTYVVQVAADCGAGEESAYTASKSFTTLCETINTFPWEENFDGIETGIPSCWRNDEGGISESYRWSASISGNPKPSMVFNGDYTFDRTNTLRTPSIELGTDKSYELSFDYRNTGTSTCQVLVNNTPVSEEYGKCSEWMQKKVSLDAYLGQTITIGWLATSNYNGYIYIDNISISEVALKPTGLTASNETQNSVDLSWTAGGDETKWEMQYKKASDGEWTAVPGQLTSTNYTLTGLTAATNYQVQVRAYIAEDDKSDWTAATSFTTECGDLVIGQVFDFEADEANATPMCWQAYKEAETGYVPYVYNSTAYAHQGSKSLFFSGVAGGSVGWAVLPKVADDVDIHELQVSAYGVSSSQDKETCLQVGIMSDPTDYSTFVGVSFPAYNKAADKASKIKLNTIDHEGKYIAFAMVGIGQVGLDNVKVTYILPKPTNVVITPSYTSAEVTFTQEKEVDGSQWKWKLGTSGAVTTINTKSISLTGLTEATDYVLFLCHTLDGEESVWVETPFTTLSNTPAPTNLNAIDITTNLATVTFEQETDKSAGWTYQYSPYDDFTLVGMVEGTVATRSIALSELREFFTYYVRIRQTCGTEWSETYAFTTARNMLQFDPYVYNFDSDVAGHVPGSWRNLHNADNTYTAVVRASDYYSSSKSLDIYNQGNSTDYFQLVAMPTAEDSEDMSKLEIEFYMKGDAAAANYRLFVGVMTDDSNVGTFESVKELTPTASWTKYTVSLEEYAGAGKSIAFYTVGGGTNEYYHIYVDDVKVIRRPEPVKELIRYHPSTQYGTICLSRKAVELEGATFWKIAYKTQDLTYIMIEQVSELEAGRAYIFMPEQENLYGVMVGESVQSPVAAADNNGLQGTFEAIVAAEINALTGNYMLYNNAFMECGKNCSMPANRAYMVLSDVCLEADAAPQQAPRRALGSGVSQTTTALNNLSENAIGVQKKIVDGRLYIVREGKTYDVDGRLVK